MKNKFKINTQDQIKSSLKKTNFYQILQLKSQASQSQIKKSYKKLALKYHPDKNSAEGSKQLFSKIVQAYDTLNNRQKRQIYDQLRKVQESKINQNQKYFNYPHKKTQKNFDFDKQRQYYRQFQKKYQQQAKKQRQEYKQNKKNQNENNANKKTGVNNNNQFYETKNNNSFYANKESNFKYKTSNRPSFNAYKSNIEQQMKFEKQKQKIKNRLYKIQVGLFIFVLWIVLYFLGPFMKGTAYYSMNQTNQYNIKVQTQILKVPFFVKSQYFQEAKDNQFKENLQKKVDQNYIKGLSKVCNNILTKQQETLQKLTKIKSKQLKKSLKMELELLDKSSCHILHKLRQMNPSYFVSLFKSKNNL